MAASSLNEFAKQLTRLRLIDPGELQQCLQELPTAVQTADGLMDALQRQNLLTNYQVNKLRKGETDALVLGDAKLLYRNGSGSFARVFRAVSVESGEMIGVKLLRQRWTADPEAIAQFHREAELLKPLRHPNIVPIYEVGIVGDHHFFTMEFIVGGNLGDMMKIRGAVSPIDATRCALDMAEGLRHALAKGISHRDMKKTNVLLATNGQAKLVDFGLGADEALHGGKKKKAQRSLDYATLEDNTGAPRNDPRSDLYFLGSIFYELLAGQPAYPRAKTREDRQQFSRYWNAQPINTVKPGLPSYVVDAVDRMMHLSPDSRHQSPTEACDELRNVLDRLDTQPRDGEQAAEPSNAASSEPTLMFVERRPDQQALLRDFFTSRGFRVLLVGDLQRALNRLGSSPPDCLVLMGGSIGQELLDGFKDAVRRSQDRPIAQVAVLSKEQLTWERRLDETISKTARVLTHPLVLGDLMTEIQEALACCNEMPR
ncbi:MAG: serine/threonine-protein kinase [Planctomycetaceae bacterium]